MQYIVFGGTIGLPIALWQTRHVLVFFEPMGSYYHSVSMPPPPAPGTLGVTPIGYGNALIAAADLGIEVHLGALGLPQVSVSARIGAEVAFSRLDFGGVIDSIFANSTSLHLTPDGDVTRILASLFAVTYYFGAAQ